MKGICLLTTAIAAQSFASDSMKNISGQPQQMDRRALDKTSSDKSPLVLLVVAAAALILFTFYRHRLTANALSRIFTVERLVEAGTMVQNDTKFPRFSIDSVMVGNKRYSSKPPNYTFLLAGESEKGSLLCSASAFLCFRAGGPENMLFCERYVAQAAWRTTRQQMKSEHQPLKSASPDRDNHPG